MLTFVWASGNQDPIPKRIAGCAFLYTVRSIMQRLHSVFLQKFT